jgi:hypothetical protein
VIVTAAARVVRRAAAVCLLSLGVLTATGLNDGFDRGIH